MREAEYYCDRYNTCYDTTTPALFDLGVWSLPQLLVGIIFGLALIWFVWRLLRPAPKPEPSLREALEKAIIDARTDASNWGEAKSVALVERLGSTIRSELSKRKQ